MIRKWQLIKFKIKKQKMDTLLGNKTKFKHNISIKMQCTKKKYKIRYLRKRYSSSLQSKETKAILKFLSLATMNK
jgi:hypothetical protein